MEKNSHKDHKGREDHEEGRKSCCSKVIGRPYDKITDFRFILYYIHDEISTVPGTSF